MKFIAVTDFMTCQIDRQSVQQVWELLTSVYWLLVIIIYPDNVDNILIWIIMTYFCNGSTFLEPLLKIQFVSSVHIEASSYNAESR